MARRAGLGRGLDSLLGEVRRDVSTSREDDEGGRSEGAPSGAVVGGISHIPIGAIKPHPDQPRRHFSDEALDELAQSIAARGVIQPIVVRRRADGFQIVAGERRWRAAQRARLHEIPAIVRDFSDSEALEIALIENIQREELNPIEEAQAYQRLIEEFDHKQAELARLVDKSRSHVANLLRLLDLPETVRQRVVEGQLSMGHARALVTLDDPEGAAARVVNEGLSVRDVEKLARAEHGHDQPRATKRRKENTQGAGAMRDPDIVALERQLGDLLGLSVLVQPEGDAGKGKLVLSYRTLDQLDMLCQRLTGEDF